MTQHRNEEYFFIKSTLVKGLLSAVGKSASEVSLDLGWGRATLSCYLNYQNKASRERINQLGKYLNQANPSTLINYQPSQKIVKYWEANQSRRKNKVKDEQYTQLSIGDNSADLDFIKDQLTKQGKLINDLANENKDLRDLIEAKFKTLDLDNGKRQGYTIGRISRIENKLDKMALQNHFRG